MNTRSNESPLQDATARRAVALLFALGVALRVALALVNWQANDDHLSVIGVLADEGRLPALDESWQSFQPKLYHASVAALWQLFDLHDTASRVLTAQAVSAAAGVATLVFVLAALRAWPLSSTARAWAFGAVALNPKLVAISAQATNDAFVIAFATLATAAGLRVLRRPAAAWAWAALLAGAVGAVLSKGNGFVAVVALALALAAGSAFEAARPAAERRRLAGGLLLLLFVVAAAAVTLGPYARQYATSGSPFGINGPTQPFPAFFEESEARRPGVRSIASALLTFRPVALLEVPFVGGEVVVWSEHRTSHWSQLYGRMHFAHFDEWPPAWRNYSPLVTWLGRVILLLALLPTLLVATGAGLATLQVLHAARRRLPGSGGAHGSAALLLLSMAAGFVAFSALYALMQRDYSVMKAIFVLPASAAFAVFAAMAWDALRSALPAHARTARIVRAGCAALGLLYVLDVWLLTAQLGSVPASEHEGNVRTHLRQIAALQPQRADVHHQLAEALLVRTPLDELRPDEARHHAERALALGAPDAAVLHDLISRARAIAAAGEDPMTSVPGRPGD